ncbi:MAG: hypothetical protein QNJ91_13400 [Gammaproteobacteria bacterium]|nr:hypothetical protein [Gammaproteobacteria bacterium]
MTHGVQQAAPYGRHGAFRRCALRTLLYGCLACLPVTAAARTVHDGAALLVEPRSGRPVERYAVDLPLSGQRQREFVIPDDCAAVIDAIERRSADKTRVLARRLWRKVGEDCWFDGYLNRHPFTEIEDHVSDYDFMNARLADLPIDRDCAPGEQHTRCQPAATDPHGVLRHFPLSEPIEPGDRGAQATACALRDGLFYGSLYVDAHSIRCEPDAGRASLRLIAVDYGDVDGNGFLDAVLRFVPIGPGAARSPLILPLSRTRPGGPFFVPGGM